MIAVVAPACSSDDSSSTTTTTVADGSSGTTPVSTAQSGGSSGAGSEAASIDPCSVVTNAVATSAYGADATVTSNPSSDKSTCQVTIQGLNYDLSVRVYPASDFASQKSFLFAKPTAVPGLGKEAVMGPGPDSQGAQMGLMFRTDKGTVYLSGESDPAKLSALASAIAANS